MNREEEMYPHVERCAAGTQSQKSYCQERDISLATFHYWRRRYLNNRPVMPGVTSSLQSALTEVELRLMAGLRLFIRTVAACLAGMMCRHLFLAL